MKAAIPLLRHF